ncbi:hypothetical protein PBAL39_13000 [Pedobacter sp. BAL39]|uniref:hypothetical protein n=1 Tax=Pedobacter sp. BAL39 TaxID=391596 RepID=UPI000155944E|nr:hypothetical protein [Pedobacter sp. BAL39]EDM35388.1 hypothetical protein PBAL39_13000 [Pedobacter sp. BAL39]
MRPLNYFITLVVLAVLFTLPATAQNQQSAIYDAIALMNLKHGINVIMIPDAIGYYTVDPLTGEKGAAGQTAPLDNSLTNVANSRGIMIQILARNAGLAAGSPEATVLAAYATNPFLKNIITTAPVAFTGGASTLRNAITPFNVDANAGAGLTNILTNVANGTADFLIKRANEEISVSVIQKLKDFTAHYPEFDVLFPRTINLIKPVAAYDYAKTLNALKIALREDLDQLPKRLPKLYHLHRYQKLNARVPVMTLIFTASEMLNSLNDKKGLSWSIHDLDTCNFLTAENNYAGFVRVVGLASDNLRKKTLADEEGQNFEYISLFDINEVTNRKTENKAELTKFFLGLLYQRGEKIPFWTGSGKRNAGELLSAWASSSDVVFENLIDRIATASSKVQKLGIELNKIKDNDMAMSQISGKTSFSVERYATINQLVVASLQLCEPFVTGSDMAAPLKEEFRRISNYWPDFSGHTIDMLKALGEKEYSLAVNDLSQMLNVASRYMEQRKADATFRSQAASAVKADADADVARVNARIATVDAKIKSLKASAPASPQDVTAIEGQREALQSEAVSLATELRESKWQRDNAEKFIFTLSKVTEYYQLFAAISEAESGKEVEALLETYALPSGSSRIKKVTNFNVALNAYVGGFFARSKTEGTGFSNQYGLTAPIGFTISHGFDKGGSLSLLAGLFDIGGVIKYKLDNEGAYQQDVNLVGLISPSAHIAYGLPFYLPLSVGAGCQWTTPATASSNSINLKPHFNLFLAVDIPLFNLSAVRKKNGN